MSSCFLFLIISGSAKDSISTTSAMVLWLQRRGYFFFFKSWGKVGNVTCVKFAPQGKILPLVSIQLGQFLIDHWHYRQLADFYHKLSSKLRVIESLTTFKSMCSMEWDTLHQLSLMTCFPKIQDRPYITYENGKGSWELHSHQLSYRKYSNSPTSHF